MEDKKENIADPIVEETLNTDLEDFTEGHSGQGKKIASTLSFVLSVLSVLLIIIWYNTLAPEKKENIMKGADSVLERNVQLQREQRVEFRDKSVPIPPLVKNGMITVLVVGSFFAMLKMVNKVTHQQTGENHDT